MISLIGSGKYELFIFNSIDFIDHNSIDIIICEPKYYGKSVLEMGWPVIIFSSESQV